MVFALLFIHACAFSLRLKTADGESWIAADSDDVGFTAVWVSVGLLSTFDGKSLHAP
ncbi:MAG: hypothetical protein ACYDDF_07495 [Thermoplasmatota archaeon]